MLDAARKVAVQANLAVQFQLASAEQTQLLAKSMDIVAAGQVSVDLQDKLLSCST
jgi:hypothetical protein